MAFNRNDPADLAALKSEIDTDPNGYGYDPVGLGTADGVINPINLKRAEITVSKPKISAANVRSTCTYDAYNNLAIDEQEWVRWMTGSGGFDSEDMVVTDDLRQQIAGSPIANDSIWATANRTEMNAAMLALIDIPGSRAEELFGFGAAISRDDWFAARDS